MEVNNTFTSLIADLPYPNRANATQNGSKQPIQQTTTIADNKAMQDSKPQNETHQNSASKHVNILV